jgi:type II secretory pathway pseudopilin PulG
MISRFQTRRGQQGYMLITLMLFVALLTIASIGWIQRVEFQIKRDREEELIHRGVQYSRAIKHFVKKFGRYPSRIEELESTNNLRFLRRRYKDPITGKDFKLLHMNDVQMSFNPGAASGMAPGSPGGSDVVQGGAPGALNVNGSSPTAAGPGPIGGNQQNAQQPGNGENSSDQQPGQNSASSDSQGSNSNQPNQNGLSNGPTFGGMPIVGVASTSKEKTIRVFNKKDHYNQWQFIYDPSTDRGGLLMTPNQPAIQGAMQINQMQNGQPINNGQNPGPAFGQGNINQPQPPQSTPQQP